MLEGNEAPDDFFGNPLDESTDESRTRVYIQNLNGLNLDRNGGKWPYICEVLSTIQADVACFTELNTEVNDFTIRQQMERTCRRHFQHNAFIMSTSKYKTPPHYKPGGTAILAVNEITAKIKSHTRDRMGRWSSICFNTQPHHKLRIILAYQVCQNSSLGSNTAAAHQSVQIIEDSLPGTTQ